MKACINFFLRLKKILLLLLSALVVKIGIKAEEIINTPVLEYFEQVIGQTGTAFVGIDTTGNGIVDTFIMIDPLEYILSRRLASQIRDIKVVSVEDKNKAYSASTGAYILTHRDILEVGGKSVLEIFPGQEGTFPREAERQARLRGQSNLPDNNSAKNMLTSTQPATFPRHFRRYGRG
jgi:hypothetical protein